MIDTPTGRAETPRSDEAHATGLDPRALAVRLKAFAIPSNRRSVWQLAITFGAFAAMWSIMWLAADQDYLISLLLAPPVAALFVRLFIIQHDCGHGSFFTTRRANDLVGRIIGVVTLTPYDYWRRAHAVHHATSGNLERRGIGDITTFTVDEYATLSRWRRLAYRLYRHPVILFGLGPIYLFVIRHRWPPDLPALKSGLWVSLMATNVAIVAITIAMAVAIGPLTLLKVQLPVVLLASSMGVWLFFVQHQFEAGRWWRDAKWAQAESALHGSSYYCLPRVLQWLTASIGLHHVHHLCSRVPNYRLQECLEAVPELKRIGRLTVPESLRAVRLTLWDEDAGRMISFRDADRRR